ncbi:hypothetical protein B0H63DRAFT_15207 [Podospora didyma]|uniref:Uncharacterized protein n=1 Tax=Podospora didyma TaxID=330526 RepID=A0AAE0U727_9PEZI|nr:hypothetical protein B0H63DRAFT_15207 [Podospora didyma]
MASLAENDFYLDKYEEKKLVSQPIFEYQFEHSAPWTSFTWNECDSVTRTERAEIIQSTKEMLQSMEADSFDLRILIGPMDHHDPIPPNDMREIVGKFGMPSCFVAERLANVTYSFGTQEDCNDHKQAAWLHLLGVIPKDPGVKKNEFGRGKGDGVPTAVYLQWTQDEKQPEEAARVTMLCFNPPRRFLRRIRALHANKTSAAWKETLQDPYMLLYLYYEAWCAALVDGCVFITTQARNMERSIFDEAQKVYDLNIEEINGTNMHEAHQIAKSTIFLLESLNAAVRSLNLAISRYAGTPATSERRVLVTGPCASSTRELLEYQRDVIESFRLRMESTEKRLQNAINLAFNIQAQKTSQIMRQDSRTVRVLSVMAMLFLPLGTVASVFSTGFFAQPDDGELVVLPKFWMLWAIAIPLTVSVLMGWVLWERRPRLVVPGSIMGVASVLACLSPQESDGEKARIPLWGAGTPEPQLGKTEL